MAISFTGKKRIRKTFGRVAEVAPMPNLIEVQKSSYDHFLQMGVLPEQRGSVGLQEVFKSVFPIRDFSERAQLEFVRYELIPMIRLDCDSPDITVMTAGASIGAFNAVALMCHYPDVVTNAIGMSGTYDISRFVGEDAGDDLYFATPSYFLPGLNGEHLALLRSRKAILASGEGRWENIGESWRLAHVLGSKGIPNRVDPWGSEYDHDWSTWREMLPKYLGELI